MIPFVFTGRRPILLDLGPRQKKHGISKHFGRISTRFQGGKSDSSRFGRVKVKKKHEISMIFDDFPSFLRVGGRSFSVWPPKSEIKQGFCDEFPSFSRVGGRFFDLVP